MVAGNTLPGSYPISDAIRAEVVVTPIYPHGQGPENCPSVLGLSKGDIVYVLEQHESGWWGGHKEGDEVTGWFPGRVAVPKPAGDCHDYDGDDENSRFELHAPIATSDHRAVASPQKGRHHDQMQLRRLTEDLAIEKKLVKELESSIGTEREKNAKLVEEVRRFEAESSRLRAERAAERSEWDRREHEWREKEGKKEAEAQTRAERETANVAHLHEELKRRDEQIQQLLAQLRQREAHRETEAPSLRVDAERLVEFSLLSDGTHGTPRGNIAREDAASRIRAASSVTRQLFTQPLSDDAPPISARSTSRHGSEQIQDGTAIGLGQLHGNSVRIASTIPPRPSPSGAHQSHSNQTTPLQAWRSVSNGPVGTLSNGAASPRCGVQALASTSHPRADGRSPVPQVRTIISEIERRSTSQTPGPVSRMADPSPAPAPCRGQPLMASAAVRSASARVGCTSRSAPVIVTTAVARAEPSCGRPLELDGIDHHPQSSPKGSGDISEIVYGMSPMGRPRVDKKPLHTGHISVPSPTPKGPSIHDRIRALYNHQK